MTAFTRAGTMSDAGLEYARAEYRKPNFFEWEKSGNAFTHRGVEVVYIFGFHNGMVKVGHTLDFITRMSAHRSSPRVRGSRLDCGWRLGTSNPGADEQVLKDLAAELGGMPMTRTTEWFTGVDARALIARAEDALVT